MHMYTHTHTHKYIHTYIHKHKHTYIYTRTYTLMLICNYYIYYIYQDEPCITFISHIGSYIYIYIHIYVLNIQIFCAFG
jgi:hypothetical protein